MLKEDLASLETIIKTHIKNIFLNVVSSNTFLNNSYTELMNR